MKHDIDIKITKNSEEKINEFDAQDYLNEYVKSGETNQVEEDKENIIPKISGWAILVMIVIVVVNFASNQSWYLKPIGRQTNVLAVLLVVLLIIKKLFKKKKQRQRWLSSACKSSTGNLSKDLKKGYFWKKFFCNGMSSTESRVSTKKAGIPMRTEPEMLDVILQTSEILQVNAVAMSGSRTDTKAPKDEFQDYDVVYVVDDLDNLTSDLSWLDPFGKRIIEQHNVLGNRRLYLMLFEDGNRIDLTLCPTEYLQEWVDSEAGFTVLEDKKGLFEPYFPSPQRFWTSPASAIDFEKACNEFWWVSAYVVKGICRNQIIYATDHLYGICQQELLKVLAWQVASDKGTVDVGKNYKYLFNYLPAEKEKGFSALLDFSSKEKITQSLFATMQLFHQEAQSLAHKMGFDYKKDVAEKMIEYAEERVKKFGNN